MLTLFACWVILHSFLSSADFFSKLTFSKNSYRNIICMSNSLHPDQARPDVGIDLVANCFQSLSADDKNGCKQAKSYEYMSL